MIQLAEAINRLEAMLRKLDPRSVEYRVLREALEVLYDIEALTLEDDWRSEAEVVDEQLALMREADCGLPF